jgi:gamma-polyglutamate biosynthesis protein CapA
MPENLNKKFNDQGLSREEVLAMEKKIGAVVFKEQLANDGFRQELKGKILAGNKKTSRVNFFPIKIWAPALAFVFVVVVASTLFYPRPKVNEEIQDSLFMNRAVPVEERSIESKSLKSPMPMAPAGVGGGMQADEATANNPDEIRNHAENAPVPTAVQSPASLSVPAGAGYNLPPSENENLSLLFFGDIMLDRHVGDKIKTASGSLEFIFSDLAKSGIFSGHDLVSANLEGAVTDGGAHYPPELAIDFAFNPKIVGELKDYGFNYFNIANNHLSDQGKNGIIETEKNLATLGFDFAGCADRQVGACTSRIIEKKGRKIGLTGASMVYGTVDEKKLLAEVSRLASSTDLVIAQMHWGTEYQHEPAKNQITLAHKLIEAGADIVIGHHPHVISGVEIYQGKPIFYSLGNFVFDQYFSTDTQEELGVDIIANGNDFTINLYPIKSKSTRLRLVSDEPSSVKAPDTEKNRFFKKLASWSIGDEAFKKQIETGAIEIKN